jgi:putative ABC transport system substrate-binding protein
MIARVAGAPALVALVLALGALAVPAAADAQPAGKVSRVGLLSFAPPSPGPPGPPFSDFLQGLAALGYREGQNMVLEARWADLKPDRVPLLAAELVRLKVDVIVTTGDGEVRAAKAATSTIPIVMAVSGDPVGSGYVASLARPGGNVTGLSFLSPDLSAKILELLKDTVPTATRVAVLWNAANPVKEIDFREAERAAQKLGLKIQSAGVRGASDFDATFAAIARDRPDALVTLVDEFMNQEANRQRITSFAAKNRLPTVAALRSFAVAGALLSYGPNLNAMFRRAAYYVDRILKGEKPANLPVEQPTTFDLVVNL